MTLDNRILSVLGTILTTCLIGTPFASAQLSPEESLESLTPADGFEVSLWASEPMVANPTGMDIDSRGRVWIAEGLNYRLWAKREPPFERVADADRIKILEDTNGDGLADKMIVFADNIFPVPMGLAVQESWQDGKYCGTRVFVGNSPNLLVLEDTDGDDRADRRYPLLTGFRGIDSDHGLHGMAFGPDGKLYFTQGDSRYGTDKREAGDITFDVLDKSGRRLRAARFGTTCRVNPDGTWFEVLGYRQRNNYETCVDSFGHVFVSDNDDDGDRGCRMIWIMDGGDYGYRTPGSSRQFAEEVPGVVPKLVGTGNGSPTGILVYEGRLFSQEYRGGVLQMDAGTHQVNFFPLERYGAAFRADYQVLLRGEDSWFRPVDAAVAPDGSLYVCDWYDAGVGGNRLSDQETGRIYWLKPAESERRVSGQTLLHGRSPFMAQHTLRPVSLIESLKSPNVATRMAARQLLLDQEDSARESLITLFRNGQPHERVRALFILADLPKTGRADVCAALQDAEPQVRETALHILASDVRCESVVAPESARTLEPRAVAVLEEILPLADDPDPGVRRELILALRHVGKEETGPTRQNGLEEPQRKLEPLLSVALLKLVAGWDGRDRYYLEALRLALRDRESDFVTKLFLGEKVVSTRIGINSRSLAWPPYYPITTNDAFLRIGDELPAADAVSKCIGLAWALQRSEALPALQTILQTNDSPEIARGADMAIGRIADPGAAELLMDRFLAIDDPGRQREILRRLGSKLSREWKPMRDTDKMQRVIDSALASDELRVEAIKTVGRSQAVSYGARLLDLARDESEELSTRAAALETTGTLKYQPALAVATDWLDRAQGESRGGPLVLAALSTLSDFQGDKTQQSFEAVLSDAESPLVFRRRALQLLARTPAGARRLLSLHRQRKLSEDLRTELTFLLHNHPDRGIRQLARQQMPVPETAGGKRIADIEDILALDGDPQRGRTLFHRQGSNACASCHRVQGMGHWVGPDLSSIGTKYGKSELLYHVLNPSGSINYNYVSYSVALSDGRVLSGLIADETTDQIVLKTAQGERVEISTDAIEVRRAQSISIMPDNLTETMTNQDLADLIAYLSILRQPVSTVGEYYVLGPLVEGTYDSTQRPDLTQSWRGLGGRNVRWRRVTTSRDDYLDLSSVSSTKKNSVVYCFVPVVSGRDQNARVVCNTSNAVKLWHNGQSVLMAKSGPTESDTYWQASLKLRSGPNSLVIAVASGQIRPGLITALITDRVVRFAFDRVGDFLIQ